MGQPPRGDTQMGEWEVVPPPLCTKGQANQGLHANLEVVPLSGLCADLKVLLPPFCTLQPCLCAKGHKLGLHKWEGVPSPFSPSACLCTEGKHRCEGAKWEGTLLPSQLWAGGLRQKLCL